MEAASDLRRIRLTASAAAIVWTAVALVSFVLYARLVHEGVTVLAAAQARAEFRKDVAYRRWAAERGGVYVPVSKETPPNPYLHVENRDIRTPSGGALTLVTAAYLTRQVLEGERERGGTVARITSATPLRPENAPDEWEAAALARLAAGAPEVVEEVEHDGEVLRYMGRLATEAACVRCHPGSRQGELRGGISIQVPMEAYLAVSDSQIERVGIAHALLWAVGLAGIAGAAARAGRRVRESARERAAREAL